MAQPLPYERDYDFQSFQSGHPTTPLPGDKVNLELDQVAETFNQVLDRIQRLQRDDLALANKSVGYDQLMDEVSLGFNPPTAWVTAKAYVRSDSVFANNGFYRCVVSHTSGVFATDLAAGNWQLVADFTSATSAAQAAQVAAEAARDLASGYATTAAGARDTAVGASAAAGTSAGNAAISETSASASAATALSAVTSANAAQLAAESARDGAVTAQNAAAVSANDAAASATAAATSADEAAASAQAAYDFATPTFATKAAAEAYAPAVAPDFLTLTGGAAVNDIGEITPFSKVGALPTDLPTPAIVHLLDGTYYRWSGRDFPLELGAKGDGITDNSSFFEDLSNAMVNFNGVIVADRGVFKTNKSLVIPKLASFVGAGRSRTKIDASGSAGVFANNAVLQKVGSAPVALPALAADVLRGSLALSFVSAHGLAADVPLLIINPTPYSGHRWRPVYQAGEYLNVQSVIDGTNVALAWPTYGEGEWSGVTDPGGGAEGTGGVYTFGGYDNATLSAYRCDGYATGMLAGVSVVAPGAAAGANGVVKAIYAQFCDSLVLSDVFADGSDHASMTLENCLRVIGRGVNARQSGAAPGYGTQYGLSIAACQFVDIGQVNLFGERHGCTVGQGSSYPILNRGIHVHDGVIASNSLALAAADWHGGTEWSSYRRLTVMRGGVNCAGNHNAAEDIEIQSPDGMAVMAREMHGWHHEFRRFRGRTGRNDSTRGILDFGGNTIVASASTVAGGVLELDDINVSAPSHTVSMVLIRNRGSTAAWRLKAQDVNYEAEGVAAAGHAAVNVLTVSGNAPTRVDVLGLSMGGAYAQKLKLGGAGDSSAKVSGLRQSGAAAGVGSTAASFVDTAITFDTPFPKVPKVTVTSQSHTSGGAGDRLVTFAKSITATGFTCRWQRCDDPVGNMTGTAALSADWIATLDE